MAGRKRRLARWGARSLAGAGLFASMAAARRRRPLMVGGGDCWLVRVATVGREHRVARGRARLLVGGGGDWWARVAAGGWGRLLAGGSVRWRAGAVACGKGRRLASWDSCWLAGTCWLVGAAAGGRVGGEPLARGWDARGAGGRLSPAGAVIAVAAVVLSDPEPPSCGGVYAGEKGVKESSASLVTTTTVPRTKNRVDTAHVFFFFVLVVVGCAYLPITWTGSIHDGVRTRTRRLMLACFRSCITGLEGL